MALSPIKVLFPGVQLYQGTQNPNKATKAPLDFRVEVSGHVAMPNHFCDLQHLTLPSIPDPTSVLSVAETPCTAVCEAYAWALEVFPVCGSALFFFYSRLVKCSAPRVQVRLAGLGSKSRWPCVQGCWTPLGLCRILETNSWTPCMSLVLRLYRAAWDVNYYY